MYRWPYVHIHFSLHFPVGRGARIGRSSSLGFAGALEIGRSTSLGLAGALGICRSSLLRPGSKTPHLPRNAAICCIWPLELGPEPQMARNGRSSPPRGRRWLEMAARACPGAAEYSTGAARACPGAAPTAVRCVRFLRSKCVRSKNAAPCSSFIGIIFCSAPPCFVHVMHGFTLVYI